MNSPMQEFWRKCSSCKKPIAFNARYFVCSVSTCNSQRTGYVFCTVPCFEIHLPGARHKDAAAIESRAPGRSPSATDATATRNPQRTIISTPSSGPSRAATGMAPKLPRETLIIASRLKEYIQARAEMNTSGQVMDVLSDYFRVLCERAIDNARSEGRKTVLDRDFSFLKT